MIRIVRMTDYVGSTRLLFRMCLGMCFGTISVLAGDNKIQSSNAQWSLPKHSFRVRQVEIIAILDVQKVRSMAEWLIELIQVLEPSFKRVRLLSSLK